MNEPTMNNMVLRLDRLERENCWLKRIVALVLIGFAAVVLMGQAKPSKVAKVIEAEKFVVRDMSGKVRASLATDSDSRPTLNFYDTKEKESMTMGFMGLTADGLPFLRLGGESGQGRVAYLGVQGLALFDRNGKARVSLNTNGPSLELYDDEAFVKLGSYVGQSRTTSFLVVLDKDQKVIWRMP